MAKKDTRTPVIFRVEDDGKVLAVFPSEAWDRAGNMACYARAGQHSSCAVDYMRQKTRPANATQVADGRGLRALWDRAIRRDAT